MKVALSLTTHEAAEHGLRHTHEESTQRVASPLGGLCPLDTSTKQQSLRLCAFQRPLSTNAADRSPVFQGQSCSKSSPQTATRPRGDKYRTARKQQGADSNTTLLQHFNLILQKHRSVTNWKLRNLVVLHHS